MSQTINIKLLVLNPKDVYRYLNVQRRRPKRTQQINNEYLDHKSNEPFLESWKVLAITSRDSFPEEYNWIP